MNKVSLIFLVLIAILVGGLYFKSTQPVKVSSIGNDVSGYISTSTSNTAWCNPSFPATQFKLLKNGYGILGSVVITNSSTGAMNIYDGTTTSSHANHATTTLAVIGASLAAGTYTYDVAVSRGVIVEMTGGCAASSTITTR